MTSMTRLDRVASVKARIGWKALTAAEYVDDGYVFLATPNIKGSHIDFENVNYINRYRYEESPELQLAVGDVLLAKDGSTLGIVNTVRHLPRPSTVNGSIAVLRPTGVESRFLAYWLQGSPIQARIQQVKDGMGVPHLFQADIRKFPVPEADLREQRRIADFLDDRVARIDQIITARGRQAIAVRSAHRSEVADLVTSGGGQWLQGSVRRFLASEDGRRIPLSTEERSIRQGPYPYYGASGVIDHVDDYLFDGPRVLLSEDGANLLMRSSPIAFVAEGKYWVNNHAHILSAPDGAYDFWAARLEALDVSPWVTGSAQPKLTIDAAMSLPLSAPAEPMARRQVGQEIGRSAADSDRRVAALKRSIDLLSEYKQSLITAAVSGELDVSTAGSGIPS